MTPYCSVPGIHLPGWHCPKCKAFNGTERFALTECRACGEPRPSVDDQPEEPDQPEEFESLPPRPRCGVCGVPNSEPHNKVSQVEWTAIASRLGDRLVSTLEKLARPAPQPAQESLPTPSPSLGDYERVLAPLRAEVVSAAMEWCHTAPPERSRLRKACEKLHETLVRLNGEYGE